MAKNSKDANNAQGVTNALWFEPECEKRDTDAFSLVIVGLDCPAEVCPELCDPDRIVPGPEFPGLCASVDEHGVKQAIQIRKLRNLETKYAKWENSTAVVHGRQRVLAARHVNKARKKAGADALIRVLGTVDLPVDARGSAITNIIANEHNRGKSPLERAKDAQRMRSMGYDDEEIGRMFGVTRGALTSWSNLLAAPPDVLARVQSGELSAATAAEVAKLPAAERAPVLAQALAAEGKDGGNVRERIRAARTSPDAGTSGDGERKRKPWKLAGIIRFAQFMDPKQNAPDDPVTDEQRLCYELARYMAGESSGKALSAFCDGRLYRWAREYAPAEKTPVSK